jgi:hypothetical protein
MQPHRALQDFRRRDSKTATGGEINCLDSAGFGTVTINKSITIKCEGCIGGVLASGLPGITINDGTNTAVVTLSGLDIEGSGAGTSGIQFISGNTLHVHKTQIRDFINNGISLTPSGGTAKVTVANSYITDSGSSVSNAGSWSGRRVARASTSALTKRNLNPTETGSSWMHPAAGARATRA